MRHITVHKALKGQLCGDRWNLCKTDICKRNFNRSASQLSSGWCQPTG